MSHPNKVRSRVLEKEVEQLAIEQGFVDTNRCYNSTGESIGLPANVDVPVTSLKGTKIPLQCKRQKKRFSQRYIPEDNIHAQVVRGDRQEAYAILRLNDYMHMLWLLEKAGLLEELPQAIL